MDELSADLDERLYKAIKSTIPNQWDFINKRPSSAAFKDSKSVSVDLGEGRSISAIKVFFEIRGFDLKAIVSLTVKQCKSFDVYLLSKPLTDNPYHCEIHDSPNKIMLSAPKAKKLSRNAKIDYSND